MMTRHYSKSVNVEFLPNGLLKICFLVAILFSYQVSSAQNDFAKELKEDLVSISDGQFSINEYNLVKIGEEQVQIQMSANAPVDVISRDNFVSFFSTVGTIMLIAIMEEAGYTLEEIEIKEIDELIGEPDLVFNIIMSKNGIQMQIITDEGTNRSTMTWEDFYEQ